MIAITDNIFSFRDNNNNANTYLIMNENQDYVLINPTINTYQQFVNKFNDLEEVTINVIYNNDITDSLYLECLKYLNQSEKLFNIYLTNLKKIKINWNKNIIVDLIKNRLELGYITLINSEFLGYDDCSYLIRYKEYIFVGNCLNNNENIKDQTLYENSLNNFLNNTPNHYFICPTYGTCNFKTFFNKK